MDREYTTTEGKDHYQNQQHDIKKRKDKVHILRSMLSVALYLLGWLTETSQTNTIHIRCDHILLLVRFDLEQLRNGRVDL